MLSVPALETFPVAQLWIFHLHPEGTEGAVEKGLQWPSYA